MSLFNSFNQLVNLVKKALTNNAHEYSQSLEIKKVCKDGRIDKFKEIYAPNQHINAQECLRVACWSGQTKMYQFLYDFFKINSEMHTHLEQDFIAAVARGNVELMEFLQQKDSRNLIIQNSNKYLYVAVKNDQGDVVDYLSNANLLNYSELGIVVEGAKNKSIYPRLEKLLLAHNLVAGSSEHKKVIKI